MVNLLRKNRKKLLSENSETKPYRKFSRYLAYGTGEIILVVIGILIALQINTWSTQQQEHNQQVNILHRLSADLSKDINNLKTKTEWIKKRLSVIDTIAKILENPAKADKKRFMALQDNLMIDNYFVPSRGTYDEGISSGRLTYIKNDSLREQIFNYYRTISNNRDNDNVQYKVTNELILPLFVEEIGATKSIAKSYLKADNQLPELDLNRLAKSKKYYQLLLYTKGEAYQIQDWDIYIKAALDLKQHIEATLSSF
tara:strand:+ start:90633 stop:91400 length:768 start_codon:yes stop_codon:yes gene_type:complete